MDSNKKADGRDESHAVSDDVWKGIGARDGHGESEDDGDEVQNDPDKSNHHAPGHEVAAKAALGQPDAHYCRLSGEIILNVRT